MSNLVLFIGLLLLLALSFAIFENFFAPACLVCESFLLAYICACYSSSAEKWDFNLHYRTVFIILTGLVFFIIGSFVTIGFKSSRCKRIIIEKNVDFLVPKTSGIIIVLFIQIIILVVYIHYYRITTGQFGTLSLSEMLRAYRFVSSYGDGLEIPIPGIVNHLTKLSRANAYVALYIVAHNLAVKGVQKKKNPSTTGILMLIVLLYVPYTILNAARFDIMLLMIMAIVIWFTFYSCYTNVIYKRKRNIRKAIWKIVGIVFLAMIVFSLMGVLVGRLESQGLITEATNYFGRTMQALDNFVLSNSYNEGIENKESIYAIVKLLKQLQLVPGNVSKFYLPFISQEGYSLGNTYTALRRYYADFGIVGVVVLTFLGGFILTYLYRKCKIPKTGCVDYMFLCYSATIYSAFLYSYEEFLWSTVVSTNYLIIFICIYISISIFLGEFKVGKKRIQFLL